MSESKHTPGPWGVEISGEGYPMIHGSEAMDPTTEARYHWIATLLPQPANLYLGGSHRETGQVAERAANARLIAAAPALLDACEVVAEFLGDWPNDDPAEQGARDVLRDAIARAKGEQS